MNHTSFPAGPAGRALAVVALCALIVSGCSLFGDRGDRQADRAAKEKLKPVKLERLKPEVRLRRAWRASVGQGLGRKYITLRPAILADRVVAADAYGTVQAFDRFSGKRLWRTRVGKPAGKGLIRGLWDRRDPAFVTGGVGAGGGLALVGTTDGEVVALDAVDGSERWRINLNTEIVAPPLHYQRQVFVQTIDGRLLARKEEDGSAVWTFDSQVPILTLRGTATPVAADGVVYTGFANGNLVALNARDGELLWTHRVMLPQGRSELDRMVDVDGSPLLAGPLIYAVSYHGRLKAVRAGDGRPLWEYETSSFHDLSSGYGHVYLVDDDSQVVAVDTQSAELAWNQEGLLRRGLTSPVAFDNYVLVGDQDGYLHVLAQSDGRFLGRTKVDGDGLRSKLIVQDDELVYVYGNSGTLTALRIESLEG